MRALRNSTYEKHGTAAPLISEAMTWLWDGTFDRDWCRFAVSWWHTFNGQMGTDPFSNVKTHLRPWDVDASMDTFLTRVDVAFEFFTKYLEVNMERWISGWTWDFRAFQGLSGHDFHWFSIFCPVPMSKAWRRLLLLPRRRRGASRFQPTRISIKFGRHLRQAVVQAKGDWRETVSRS